jgi:transposase InsO family protein
MMNGDVVVCKRAAVVEVVVQGFRVTLDCLIAGVVPGFDLLLGMDAVAMLGGVQVDLAGVRFLGGGSVAAALSDVCIEDKDFVASFRGGAWTVSWRWVGEPPVLMNRVPAYRVPPDARQEYEDEILDWIRAGWLQPYDGPYDGIIPLMAVVQPNKGKVRPVLDYRELNGHVSSHTADGEVCSDKLRAWRRMGDNLSIVDLRKAYLQIRVDPSLWRYQVVEHGGKHYCLTRLGFGLNVAPKIMSAIVNKVLSLDKRVRAGTDSFVDDIVVNNDVVPCERVVQHLCDFGLEAKPPEMLDGCRVLGLRVERSGDLLAWRRDNKVGVISDCTTKRQLFSWCGQLTSHYPVAGWLRPCCSYLKRRTSELMWDGVVSEQILRMAREMQQQVQADDPVRGVWTVPKIRSGRVWCDASSLAIGVVLEIGARVVEDASWLRKVDDAAHINLAELEGILKGLNLALAWQLRNLVIMCDSATVCAWMRSLLSGDKPLRVKGLGEALVRRRLSLIEDVIKEYGLVVEVTQVASCENKADCLTRVPQRWLLSQNLCAAAVTAGVSAVDIRAAHEEHHLGTDRTLHLVRRSHPGVAIARRDVESVVQACAQCRSIDPAPIQWERGTLEVEENWWRVACDITHHGGSKYLTLIDCGPSRFAIWRRVATEGSQDVISQLDEIFRERGPPWQLLSDNGSVFRSQEMRAFCESWGIDQLFRSAYRPSGNGVVERNHRTIKRMAARSGGNILKMVFWYNLSPMEGVDSRSVPSYNVFNYEWKPPGVALEKSTTPENGFIPGEKVYVKPSHARCTSRWARGVVTGAAGPLSVEVDGIPRHVADVRRVETAGQSVTDEDTNDNESEDADDGETMYHRPVRMRRLPGRFDDFQM